MDGFKMNFKQKILTGIALPVLIISAANAPWEYTQPEITGVQLSQERTLFAPIWSPPELEQVNKCHLNVASWLGTLFVIGVAYVGLLFLLKTKPMDRKSLLESAVKKRLAKEWLLFWKSLFFGCILAIISACVLATLAYLGFLGHGLGGAPNGSPYDCVPIAVFFIPLAILFRVASIVAKGFKHINEWAKKVSSEDDTKDAAETKKQQPDSSGPVKP